jgi:phosphoribosylaminoimidazole-succinocarboxamide synthase
MSQKGFNQVLIGEGIPTPIQGKVRDIYDLGNQLLLVASDRISAYDVVMPDLVPGKGIILTKTSNIWFDIMQPIISNHLIQRDSRFFPKAFLSYADILRDRAVLVKKAMPLVIECIVRGYITGSGWQSYQENGTVCGIKLPSGLRESDQLTEPIFTPSTKEKGGAHDINISFDDAVKLVGKNIAEMVRDFSLAIYKKAAAIAERKGVIIADTKFEFGIRNGELILIDELLTSDSSRFWPKDTYQPGGPQKSLDKQYLRDYLTSIKWNKQPPAPALPDNVIQTTLEKYRQGNIALFG